MTHRVVTEHDWRLLDIVLAVVALLGAWPVAGLFAGLLRGRALSFEGYAVVDPPPVDDPQLDAGVHAVYTGAARFTVPDPSPVEWLCALAIPLATMVVVIVALLSVRRLMRNVRAGRSFHASSLRAVRVLGMVLFCYGPLRPLAHLLTMVCLTTPMRNGDLQVVFRIDPGSAWPVAIGLIVGVVGEGVFGHGRDLARDTEGLV